MSNRQKKKKLRQHALRRSRRRLGFAVDADRVIAEIQGEIPDGNAEFLERQSGNITLWKCEQNGVEFVAVYSSEFSELKTVMTMGMYRGEGIYGIFG